MTTANTATNQTLVAEVIDKGQVSAQQILVIVLCLFFNMLDGFDITAMAVVASSVATELVLSPDQLGWIFSFALAGMMIGAMFLGPVSDQIGRRKLVIISIVLVGVSVLLTSQATSLTEFIVLRFVAGVGAGAMLTCQAALAAEYSPEKYRALSVLLVGSGYSLGAMMTSVVANYVMPEYGWRGMFLFGGGLTVAMVVVAFALIPESLSYLFERRPNHALERVNKILRKLKKPEVDALPELAVAPSSGGVLTNVKKLLETDHKKLTLTLWTAFLLSFSTLYFLMSWIPKLMEDSGFGAATGRQAFFLFNLGGIIGTYLAGILSTRLKLTNLVMVMLVASAVGMIVFAYAPAHRNLLLGLIMAIGIMAQGGFIGLSGAAAKAYPTKIRSTGIGWCLGLGRSGAVAGPAVAGYLIAAGFDMSANFVFFAVPMAISGFIAYRLHIR